MQPECTRRGEHRPLGDPAVADHGHQPDLSGGNAGLSQVLSAAPELVDRWEQDDNPYGQAVITAAVTARRCGHPEPIPAPALEAIAEGHHTPSSAPSPETSGSPTP